MQRQSVIWRPPIIHPPHPVSSCITYLIPPPKNFAPSMLGMCLDTSMAIGASLNTALTGSCSMSVDIEFSIPIHDECRSHAERCHIPYLYMTGNILRTPCPSIAPTLCPPAALHRHFLG